MRPVCPPASSATFVSGISPRRLTALGAALTLALAAGGASAGESRTAAGKSEPASRADATSPRHVTDAEPGNAFWRRVQAWIALGKSDEGGEPDPEPPNDGN